MDLAPEPVAVLNHDVLCTVFAFLSADERFLAKQVCRRWREVIRSRRGWRAEPLTPQFYLTHMKFYGLAAVRLRAVPLSRLLPQACRLEAEVFFELVESRRDALNPDVVKLCEELAGDEEVRKWCAGWEPTLEDIRLHEATRAGSPRSARLALRSGATLVDWALCAAVKNGNVRSAVQMLKRGARDWVPARCPSVRRTSGEVGQLPANRDQGRAIAACLKWLAVTPPVRG